MVAILIKHGVLRTGKATMAMIGVDVGPTRAPIAPLTADETKLVQAAYERLGVLAGGADVAPAVTTLDGAAQSVVAG